MRRIEGVEQRETFGHWGGGGWQRGTFACSRLYGAKRNRTAYWGQNRALKRGRESSKNWGNRVQMLEKGPPFMDLKDPHSKEKLKTRTRGKARNQSKGPAARTSPKKIQPAREEGLWCMKHTLGIRVNRGESGIFGRERTSKRKPRSSCLY